MSDEIKKAKAAGGMPAIVATVKTVSAEMGLVRGVRTLLKINQPGGVDCPGCAWPEPDRERSHFEFCENGAKHVADEATTKRVTPEFFQAVERRRPLAAIGSMAGRAGTAHSSDAAASWRDSLRTSELGRCFRAASPVNSTHSTIPTRRSFTLPAAPATKRRFFINCSYASLARTICLIVQTCVTSRADRR